MCLPEGYDHLGRRKLGETIGPGYRNTLGKNVSLGVRLTTFEIAHINEQGVNVVVVFVDAAVAHKSAEEQNVIAANLQRCAESANLAGSIAMVWPGGFWAPSNQHAFFRSRGGSYAQLRLRINKNLSCA